jgi:hypothetical protein
VTAGPVSSVTEVTITASLAGKTVTGQLQIHPARVVTALTVGPSVSNASQATGGTVSISVPAVDNNFAVAMHSSNPAVVGVPASVDFLTAQSRTSFSMSIGQVTTATDVTISATAGGVTISTTMTVVPTPPPAFTLLTVTTSPGTVAGAGTAIGTVTASTGAPAGGAMVKLSTSDAKLATVPATVVIPAGSTTATFPIKVTGQSASVAVGISALFANRGPSTTLGVTSSKGGVVIAEPASFIASPQYLAPRPVGDPNLDIVGTYAGGTGSIESGQMPPGVSLISNLRPGQFDFHGSPTKAGTYTFVLKFTGAVTTPYVSAYVWVVTP